MCGDDAIAANSPGAALDRGAESELEAVCGDDAIEADSPGQHWTGGGV